MTSPEPRPAAGGARRIREVAERLFAERGYDATSVTAIAREAQVSKANVFHHFGSKRALYLAALREACEQIAELLTPAGAGETSVRGRLERFLAGHLAHVQERAGLTRLVLRELLEPDHDGARELAEQALGQGFGQLVALIQEGQQAGVLRAGIDPAVAAVVMIGANIFFFQSRPVLRHLPEVSFADDPDRYNAGVAELLFIGLEPPDGHDRPSTAQERKR